MQTMTMTSKMMNHVIMLTVMKETKLSKVQVMTTKVGEGDDDDYDGCCVLLQGISGDGNSKQTTICDHHWR
jgi:hypothetical protein